MPALGPQVVFVDANVWFSRTLRDWIGLLYTTPNDAPFDVRWTEDVLAEVLYHLRRTHPDWEGGRITGIRDSLAGTFETGRVDNFGTSAGYRGHDPLDAHVHAAAVACHADYLLTVNTADFAWEGNEAPYEVLTPDEFFLLVDDAAPDMVDTVISTMCTYWLNRKREANLPTHLKTAGCPTFAERVREHLQHHRF